MTRVRVPTGVWKGFFLFATVSRQALGPNHVSVQWVPGALSAEVKRLGREADLSPPSSAEVKNAWICVYTPLYVFMASYLVKHRDNFAFFTSSQVMVENNLYKLL